MSEEITGLVESIRLVPGRAGDIEVFLRESQSGATTLPTAPHPVRRANSFSVAAGAVLTWNGKRVKIETLVRKLLDTKSPVQVILHPEGGDPPPLPWEVSLRTDFTSIKGPLPAESNANQEGG